MWTMDLERFKEGKAKLSHGGRPQTARGWRLWVAHSLCATCEAKIDDSSHQLLLLLHTGHQLWCSPRLAPGHQLVLEQGVSAGWALVHKCAGVCMDSSGELSSGASYIQYTPAHSLTDVCVTCPAPSSFTLLVEMSVTVLNSSECSC